MKRLLVALFLVLLLGVLVLMRDRPPFSGVKFFHSSAGAKALDFELPALNSGEERIALSSVTGNHPVLLVFWASWCPACVEEIPTLNEWHDVFSPKGLRILSVNVQEPRDQVEAFRLRHAIRYPVLLDEDGSVAGRFGLIGLPASVFLAKGGEIIYYGFSLPLHIDQMIE